MRRRLLASEESCQRIKPNYCLAFLVKTSSVAFPEKTKFGNRIVLIFLLIKMKKKTCPCVLILTLDWYTNTFSFIHTLYFFFYVLMLITLLKLFSNMNNLYKVNKALNFVNVYNLNILNVCFLRLFK